MLPGANEAPFHRRTGCLSPIWLPSGCCEPASMRYCIDVARIKHLHANISIRSTSTYKQNSYHQANIQSQTHFYLLVARQSVGTCHRMSIRCLQQAAGQCTPRSSGSCPDHLSEVSAACDDLRHVVMLCMHGLSQCTLQTYRQGHQRNASLARLGAAQFPPIMSLQHAASGSAKCDAEQHLHASQVTTRWP